MENIENLKFMSLGGNCADIGYLGNQRIHGPVDNMFANKGLSSVKQLIENNLLKDFLSNDGKFNESTKWVDFESYSLVSNKRNEEFLENLKLRVGTFNTFLKHIQEDDHYFVYTLNYMDVKNGKLTENFLDGLYWLESQPFANKVIFVSTPVSQGFNSCYRFSYDFKEYPQLKVVQIHNMAANPEDDKRCHRDFLVELKKTNLWKNRIDNLKFMSIGGNCMDLSYLGDMRVRGPIDNIKSLKGIHGGIMALLHPDEVYRELTGPWKTCEKSGKWLAYTFDNFAIFHNDPTSIKYQVELKRRLDVLQQFYKNIHKKDHYFVYSLIPSDVTMAKDETHFSLTNQIKEGIENIRELGFLDKVIFVGGISETFVKEKYFIFNSDEMYDIPGVKYIEIKNPATTDEDQMRYSYKQFIRKLRYLDL